MAFGFLLVAVLVTWCPPRASWASSVTYVPYTMEDSCDGAARTIHIPSSGPGSAIIVRSHQGTHYKSGVTCHFIVKTNQGYRILVVFDALQFPGNEGNCSDSLMLSNAEDVNGPICSSSTKDVVSKENVLNLTWTTGGGTAASVNDGFEAIITAYKPGSRFCTFSEYKCDNHRCVADNLACDGHNNCGDNSDEKCDFGSTFWRTYASTVLMVGGLLVVGLCMVCPLILRGCSTRDDQPNMSRPNTPAIASVANRQPEQPAQGSDNSGTTTSTGSDQKGSGTESKEIGKNVSAKKVSSQVSSKLRRSPTPQVLVPTAPSKKVTRNKNTSEGPVIAHCRCSSKDISRRLPKATELEPYAEPLSTTSYRCIRIPPGKTLSSELPPRSPLYHAYGLAAASLAKATTGGNSSSKPSDRPLARDLEATFGYPASAAVVEATTTSFVEPPEPIRPADTTPSLYVLRPMSSLSQDDNVECDIREVSCGLVRGPEFTPLIASTFQVVRRAIPLAEVHQPRRPRRFSFSRPASSSSNGTSQRADSPPPPSTSPRHGSQMGRDNRGYCSE